MMEQEENFDDLIRQKFDEKEFVFNEENWEKAEKKIDSVRRLSKISLWTSIFIIGLIIGVGLSILYIKNSKEDTKNISQINIQKDTKSENVSNPNSEIEKPISPTTSEIQNENPASLNNDVKGNALESKGISNAADDNNIEKNIKKEDLKKDNPKSTAPASLKEFAKEKVIAEKENKISNNQKVLIADKTASPIKEINKKEAVKSERIVNKVSKKNSNYSIAIEEKVQKNKETPVLKEIVQSGKSSDQKQSAVTENLAEKKESKINSVEIPSSQLEQKSQKNSDEASHTNINGEGKVKSEVPAAAAILGQNPEVKGNLETNTVEPKEPKSQINNNAVSATQIAAGQKSNNEPQAAAPKLTQNVENKSDSVNNSATETETAMLEKNIASPKLDSLISPQNNLVPPPPLSGGLASATIFAIDAGTNFEAGWTYSDASEAGGFNPVLGVGITHFFNPKWALRSGIEYGSIYYLKASQKVFSSTTYSFGSITVDKVIDTKLLHYAILPLMFQYNFNDKNTLTVGGSISYLVNSKSKVTINTTTIAPMPLDSTQSGTIPNTAVSTEKIETGYYANAFNKWDASISVGYRRRLSQNFSAAATANFGLLDIKSNTFFLRENFERNIGMKITISYNLFEF